MELGHKATIYFEKNCGKGAFLILYSDSFHALDFKKDKIAR